MRRFVLALGLLAAPSAPALAAAWTVDPDASRVGFVFTQAGAENEGRFETFEAEIDFDPEAPEAGRVRAVIDVGSITTGNPERDATVQGAEWLGAEAHPEAVFEGRGFEPTGDGAYELPGRLTLKGVTQDAILPVTISVEDERATAEGTITIDRTDFEVGTGQWAAGSVVGKEVKIVLDLEAAAE